MSNARNPLICFLSSEHPPYDKRVFDKEAVSLARSGFRVTHLCPNEVQGRDVVRGVEVVSYRRMRGKIPRFLNLPHLYRMARTIDADAYHCNEPDSWLVGVLMRLVHGKIVIFDCHEHYPGQVVRWLPKPLRRIGAFLCGCYLQVLGLFTNLIVIAKYSVADDFSWSRHRQLVVLNTTPLAALERQNTDRSLFPRRKASNNYFSFVHIGVFRRERGSEQLLEALEHLKNWRYKNYKVVIIGEFKDGSEPDFFEMAKNKGVLDNIEFHRWMPFDKAFEMVCQCHAGLVLFQKDLSNNVYGMPHKMFDYMLAGLPVIAPDFAPDIVRVLKESRCGLLIDTSNTELLAKSMKTLIDNPSLSVRLGLQGQRAVREKYNWENEAEKLISTYRQLLVKG